MSRYAGLIQICYHCTQVKTIYNLYKMYCIYIHNHKIKQTKQPRHSWSVCEGMDCCFLSWPVCRVGEQGCKMHLLSGSLSIATLSYLHILTALHYPPPASSLQGRYKNHSIYPCHHFQHLVFAVAS